jgi:hypothetical protein
MNDFLDSKRCGIGSTIKTGINIFNQGRTGSTTEKIINRISGPSGLNMSSPSNHQNDLGFRAGNAIKSTISNLRR